MSSQGLLFCVPLLCTVLVLTTAQLSREDKQLLLDIHNFHRASVNAANMRRLDWSRDLEESAREEAEKCEGIKERGTNTFHNITQLSNDRLEAFAAIVAPWTRENSVQQPVLWQRTTLMGCAMTSCDRLALDDGGRVFGTQFLVCKYAPTYFTREDGQLYREGPCSSSTCPTDASICVSYGGGVAGSGGGQYCASDENNPVVPASDDDPLTPVNRAVWWMTPRDGSLGGGNRISIRGTGFSSNQFEGGNTVMFMNENDPEGDSFPCDVVSYRTSEGQIECITREAPVKDQDTTYSVRVSSNDGSGFEDITPCSGCTFRYRVNGFTTNLRNMGPLASLPGTPVTLIGTFRATGFEDSDDPKDAASTDQDDDGDDYFTRILVGGHGCDPMRENGSLYGSAIESDLVTSSIQCLPPLEGIIDSHNVSVVLANRGMAYVRPEDNLVALDNKLRPYHFQTHADILDVTPRRGSMLGGTRVSITVSNSLVEYQDDIMVYVGGLPCMNVTVYANQSDYGYGVIECTTDRRPSPSTYYPGGRGTLREVFLGQPNLDIIQQSSRSENNIVHDRLFLFSFLTEPDFGEEFFFGQRFSGFFVPPRTSLYTFNARSDDRSRLFLSPNASSEHARLIVDTLEHTRLRWDYHTRQYSEPMFLEAGSHYYFEFMSINYGGPWDAGIGVKLHDSTLIGGLYDGDYEEQQISITSNTVEEIHVVNLEASPAVQCVTLEGVRPEVEQSQLTASITCAVSMDITRGGDAVASVSFSPFSSASQLEEMLNAVQEIAATGSVAVKRQGYEGSEVGFWFSDAQVEFTIIFLTRLGVPDSDVLTLALRPEASCLSGDDSNSTQLELTMAIKTIQNANSPATFDVGFNISSQLERVTRPLPLDTTSETLREELTGLLSQGCVEEAGLAEKTLLYENYESSGSSRRDNSTSFCGVYSQRDSSQIWSTSDEAFRISDYPYLCFAQRGSFVNLRVLVDYRELESNSDNPTIIVRDRRIDFAMNQWRCSSWPFPGPYGPDGWTDYTCFNMRECMNEWLPDSEFVRTDRHTVSRIRFGGRSGFFLDNVAIARTPIGVSRVATQFPVRPNGVTINYFAIDGGALDYPTLVEPSTEGEGYSMVVSRFEVGFNVLDCGYGIGLLVGGYDDDTAVAVDRVQAASRSISGQFHITIGGKSLRDINANVTGSDLQQLMNLAFNEEQGFSVSRSGDCTGYSWTIRWTKKPGDQPLIGIEDDLVGPEVEITVNTLVDGGTWIRPLRGDMLRTPETEPQVEVIVNGIPSSCTSNNCSFSFDESLTPTILSLTPSEGQAGTSVTIEGTGFGDGFEDLQVMIGGVECTVTSASDDEINCTAALHSAGCYAVEVAVEGRGVAYTGDSLCFRYLLSVDSVSPTMGGVTGGQVITLSGAGFIEFAPMSREESRMSFPPLPWFRHGVGAPAFRDMDIQRTSFPHTEESPESSMDMPADGSDDLEGLLTHLEYIYSHSPLSVSVGGSPCVVVESTITELSCVPLPGLEGTADITVTVLDQNTTLEQAYTVSASATPAIDSLTPSNGPVTGGTSVTITGRLFGDGGLESVQVMVGDSECVVSSADSSSIQCTTSQHRPCSVPVIISVSAGIAVLDSALLEWNDTADVFDSFPAFSYELQVTGLSSSGGSVLGGTEVTVLGGNFVEGYTEVILGGNPAEILSCSSNEIVFLTPSSVKSHVIELSAQPVVMTSAFSTRVTYQLTWSTNEIEIVVGDSITWDWDLDLPITPELELDLFEVEPSQSEGSDGFIPKPGGLSNEGTSADFTVIFTEVGTRYFATENNFNPGEKLITVVHVIEPQAMQTSVEVRVANFLAEYVPGTESGSAEPVEGRKRRQVDTSGEECVDDLSLEIPIEDGPSFNYSPCLTPIVYQVEPQMGNRLTTFTITGERFSTNEGANIVMFGGVPCEVANQTDTIIACTLSSDPSYMPTAFTALPISLTNTDQGFGDAYVPSPSDATVTLYPLISEISPRKGSVAGGTDLIIRGDTFSFEQDVLAIRIDTYPCKVTSVQYQEIRCQTTPSSDGELIMADVLLYDVKTGNEIQTMCDDIDDEDCSFDYSDLCTPIVDSVSPTTITTACTTTIEITGDGFADTPEGNRVYLGEAPCLVTVANETDISCELEALPAGDYPLSLKVCNLTEGRCFGNALVDEGVVTVGTAITGLVPVSGSTLGGTVVTISGYGFNDTSSSITVTMGTSSCEVTMVTLDTIQCITSANSPGGMIVSVMDGNRVIPPEDEALFYAFTMDATPLVSAIIPNDGQTGDEVSLIGDGFGNSAEFVKVFIGGEPCEVVTLVNASVVTCELGVNFAGSHDVQLSVDGVGRAVVAEGVSFTYNLVLTSISDTTGSLVGQNTLEVVGFGFDPSDTTITICDRICSPTPDVPSVTQIGCVVPPASDDDLALGEDVIACDVVATTVGMAVTFPEQYVYRRDLTPQVTSVNDTRGGTEGGTRLTITGSGFTASATVAIAGSPCIVSSTTESTIECTTERSGRTIRAKVMVFIEGKGFAMSDVYFWYVDVWSSPFTWGGGPLPQEGDFVVIPRGQTLILDVKTPILGYLLIQGGELIFDQDKGDNEVELHTQGALITSGGRLQVGTEEAPFMSKTQIVLYGHVLSTEIPVYGAKTLALRQGELDLHGRPLDVTWTRLAQTAEAGATEITLQDFVDWEVGGRIVLSSTSFSQRENEEMEIESIRAGATGSILRLTEPLQYQHISVSQMVAGRTLETRGEVGYLTRNVVVRGNVNEEWNTVVENCPEEFRPGQFQVQTCFQGRFGAEIVGDQFGSQIMIHAAVQNQGHVTARIEYIEVTHAGQAFRLGRYPIHFHLNGNVTGSYVRGCGIHHTFNRAVTMHAVDHLLVEKNVAFNILGHAYFLEDGIEQFNIIQDNLGVFVRASSSLLNVDITPATFWVVNANNILRRNAAAGGTHFGFWYRLPTNPTGPSFTTTVCPRRQRVLEFSGNSAHSFGWYGLWVFRQYFPSLEGNCGDTDHAPSYYDDFFAWRNDRGVEFAEVGALQLRNSVMLDNKLAGVEITEIESIWSEELGPLISNVLIVGHSAISDDELCTESGIKTPKSYYLSVAGVTFANFDRPNCYPLQSCSHCKFRQGGFETRYREMTFVNAGDKLTKWQWEHEHIHRDLDGSLTQSDGPRLLIPTNQLLDPEKCSIHAPSSDGAAGNGTMGSICDGDVNFGRLAVYNPSPSSLESTAINVTNEHGITHLPYVFKRLRGTGPGYMTHVELNRTYNLVWLEGQSFTNISYQTKISGFGFDDYIVMRQQYLMSLDSTVVAGVSDAVNATVLDDPASANTGDFSISDDNQLSYIIKGGNFPLNERETTYSTFRCFYLDCIPPPPPTLPPPIPPGRPANVMMWSNASIWPNAVLPTEGDNVTIPRDMYVLVDVPTPRLGMLKIEGGMEMFDSSDRVLEADLIIIDGGRLVAGYPETPFQHNLRIILHGNNRTRELLGFEFGSPTIGAKAIAVFGELILNAEPQTSPTWSLLATTVNPGDTQLTLTEAVDWRAGDTIVVTSTSYDAFETEVFTVVSVSQSTVNLNDSFRFTHLAEEGTIGSVHYTIRAEVGHLTRKIVIENGEPELAFEQAFGCRVLVSSNTQSDFRGTVQLQGVEFNGCGQLGYTDDFDPRFALAMFNTGGQSTSYIRECSFHDGFNTAVGIFGSDEMTISDNVIHSTVGPSMVLGGARHVVQRNLASLSQFLGTYRERFEPLNDLWTANYEIAETTAITFTNNHAAGGGKAGIHSDGDECTDTSPSTIQHNVAHSSLHCFHTGYRDGSLNGCSRFANLMAYSCYHYGLFVFSEPGVEIMDSTFINNKVGIFVSIFGPPSLSHVVGTKPALIQRTNVISAGLSFDCSDDDNRPRIANHPRSHFGIQTPSGGHVGVVIPTFVSSRGGFPKFPWPTAHSYPAIAGVSMLSGVSFVNFAERCDNKNDAALITSSFVEDAHHPVHMQGIVFESDERYAVGDLGIQPEFKVFIHEPNIGSINPSDCVDMDCDGNKHVLLRDLDGSFTQRGSARSLVGFAELEWDGDRRRGIGDFRIPKTMLSNADGSRIPVDDIYPQKGIVRGTNFGDSSQCTFNADWTLYECSGLDHLMIVLESLDADTEVRRLSPIGIGSNGFIDLLNGPMDNGWCGGYTCQERISTFYGIVAAGLKYVVGLTSTNPQNFGMHLLNSNDDEAVVLCIIYNNPQRLDVYRTAGGQDEYIPPKNAEFTNGELKYMDFDPNLGDDQFNPVLSDPHGANYYDRSLKQLNVLVRGSETYKVITTPVIMLSLTVSTTVDNFFDEDVLVRNLALLLNIPDNKIRIVNVVRESRRRRRQADGSTMETIDVEIGDPPAPVIDVVVMDDSMNDTVYNDTSNMQMNTTDAPDPANVTDTLSIDRLAELTEMVAAVVQTGEILQGSNGSLVAAEIEEPVPPPVDPTGGVRATPDTGGPQPEDVGENSTIQTFFEQQQLQEQIAQNESTPTLQLSIPSRLMFTRPPNQLGIVEGVALRSQLAPIVSMLDNNNEIAASLGVGIPWSLTVTVLSGPSGAFLTNATVKFVQGHAMFEGLIFSHPGSYVLHFLVTLPTTADFTIMSQSVVVAPRSLSLYITQQPQNGNTTFSLYPPPAVRLLEGEVPLQDHTWRNSTWYVTALVEYRDTILSWRSELVVGVAYFPNIKLPAAGRYSIHFEASTLPSAPDSHLPDRVTSERFSVNALQFTRFIVTYDVDFDTVVGDTETAFIEAFEALFLSKYPTAEIFNTTIREGSIIVSIFVTARTTKQLVDIIDQVTSAPNSTLTLAFNGVTLVPSVVEQDPAYPVHLEDRLLLILATTIPAGVILLCGLLLICMVCLCRMKKGTKDEFDIKVSPTFKDGYVGHNSGSSQLLNEKSSLNDYYLEECEMGDMRSTPPTPATGRKDNLYVTSSELVEVSVIHDYVVSNPMATESDEQQFQESPTKEDLGSK